MLLREGITMTRRQEREQAFILIFENNFQDEPLPARIDAALLARDFEVSDFAERIASGVEKNLSLIDQAIEKHIIGWKKSRVSKVAISALRLAVFEMMFENSIPASVSINEAVELCKKFASEEDSSFVNGILGSIARENGAK